MVDEIKEYLPKTGYLFSEYSLYPIFCKPKLLPLKSVTLEKLERMQKEAQDKVIEQERLATAVTQINMPNAANKTLQQNISSRKSFDATSQPRPNATVAEVWRPDDEPSEKSVSENEYK